MPGIQDNAKAVAGISEDVHRVAWGIPDMQNDEFKDLPPIFRRKKRIAAVYLFGSAATGRDRRGSDLDLAIVAKRTISGRERLRIEAELSSRLRRDVDLVVFGQAAPLLQHQILKYGRLICENDPAERVRQEVRARAEYLDTRYLFREIQ